MSERKVEVNAAPDSSASDQISQEEIESRADKKARRALVLDRGTVGARLHVDLPPELHGEWVRNTKEDIFRKESLGFKIDETYARQRKLHDKGDAASYVGDVVFMTCSMEDKEILDEIRRERYDKIHNPKGGKQKEEKEFLAQAAEPDVTVKSNVRAAKKADITAAINAAANNKT